MFKKKSIYTSYSDSELAEFISKGDHRAFREIYDRYFGVIYSFSRKMLQDDGHAEDITQDIFTVLYERMGVLKIVSLRSYLYQSARYAIIDYGRKNQHRVEYMKGLGDYYERGEWTTDNAVIENELSNLIEEEIANLPVKMRAVFELSRKHYLSNKEIAEQTGLSEGTVRLQIHHAISRLRSRLTMFILLLFMTALVWFNKIF